MFPKKITCPFLLIETPEWNETKYLLEINLENETKFYLKAGTYKTSFKTKILLA